MVKPTQEALTPEEFKLMTERAGLGLSPQELEVLQPIYELYLPYLKLLHSIDLQAEEIGVTFHPDWT